VRSWDGRAAVVEHDGSCVLVLRRTYYPGWSYRVDGGPEHPVLKVDGGLHGIPLAGSGTHRVEVRYRPTGLRRAATISLAALGAAVVVLVAAGWRAVRAGTDGKSTTAEDAEGAEKNPSMSSRRYTI
jgi:hypothetical protein